MLLLCVAIAGVSGVQDYQKYASPKMHFRAWPQNSFWGQGLEVNWSQNSFSGPGPKQIFGPGPKMTFRARLTIEAGPKTHFRARPQYQVSVKQAGG